MPQVKVRLVRLVRLMHLLVADFILAPIDLPQFCNRQEAEYYLTYEAGGTANPSRSGMAIFDVERNSE